MAKVGRRAEYVRDGDGNPVNGLYAEKTSRSDGNGGKLVRYWSKATDGKRVYHGDSRDLAAAIWRFRRWTEQQQGATLSLPTGKTRDLPGPPSAAQQAYLDALPPHRRPTIRDGKVISEMRIPESVYWARVRDDLMNRPTIVAMKTGLAEVARLRELPKPTAPLPLQKVIDDYAGKRVPVIDPDGKQRVHAGHPVWDFEGGRSFAYKSQRANAHKYWSDFCGQVGATTLEQITPDGLRKLDGWLRRHAKAPRTRKNFIRTIQSALNDAWSMNEGHRLTVDRVKENIARICPLTKEKRGLQFEPDKQDFLTLLEAVKDCPRWNAMLLCSLNFALHPRELTEIRKGECNLGTRTFRTNRTKTGIDRVARIWDRTAKAIDLYRQSDDGRENTSEFLFGNSKRLSYSALAEQFANRRRWAGLDKPAEGKRLFEFDHIRKLFSTLAGATDLIGESFVMGHALRGERDVYKYRPVEATDAVCSKVEAEVFGQKAVKK